MIRRVRGESSKKCLFMCVSPVRCCFACDPVPCRLLWLHCTTTPGEMSSPVPCNLLFAQNLYRAFVQFGTVQGGGGVILYIYKIKAGVKLWLYLQKRLTNDKYNAKCTQINIKPLSQEAAAIKAAAAASGQSLQGYILQAVRARMQAEGQPLTVGDPSGPNP